MSIYIDLNADLGEGFGVYSYGRDDELIPLVSSVNVACGWHGGDPAVIRRAVRLAVKHGVAVGAHPGYPDLAGFGRRYMALSPDEVTDSLLMQIGGLDGICRAEGTRVRYVKPHGALYNAAAKDAKLAEGVVRAVRQYNRELLLLCPEGSEIEKAAKAADIRTAFEFFADRAYREDGSLVPRSEEGAVIHDSEIIKARVLGAVRKKRVTTSSGKEIFIRFDSICLHGDNPEAVESAKAIRKALDESGICVRPFSAV